MFYNIICMIDNPCGPLVTQYTVQEFCRYLPMLLSVVSVIVDCAVNLSSYHGNLRAHLTHINPYKLYIM